MNKIHKSQYNESLGAWVAVPEIAKGKGKSVSVAKDVLSTSSSLPKFAVSALSLALLQVVSVSAYGAADAQLGWSTTVSKNCIGSDSSFSCGDVTLVSNETKIVGTTIGSNIYANMSTAIGNDISIGSEEGIKKYNDAINNAKEISKKTFGDESHYQEIYSSNVSKKKNDISSGSAGKYSVALGNRINIQTANTVALGNDISSTKNNSVDNSVFLGNNSGYVSKPDYSLGNDSSAGLDKVRLDNLKSIPDYAGPTNVAGVVSVASGDKTRRIQGVAPGLVAENSADAINGAQLHAAYEKINVLSDGWNINKVSKEDIDSSYKDITQKTPIKAKSTVNFAGSDTVSVSVKKNNKDKNEFAVQFDINKDAVNLAVSKELPVIYTDEAGNLVHRASDNKWYKAVDINANGTPKNGAQSVGDNGIIASLNHPSSGENVRGDSFTLANVAKGAVSSTSTDAINGSQLFAERQNLAKVLGGGAEAAPDTIDSNGNVVVGFTAPSYNIVDGKGGSIDTIDTAHNVGDALTNLNKYVNEGITVAHKEANAKNDVAKATLTPASKITFADGANTTVSVEKTDGTNADNATITIDVDSKQILANVPVVYTDKDGNPIYKDGDKWYRNGEKDPFTPDEKITTVSVVNPNPDTSENKTGTTDPVRIQNVAKGIDGTDAVNKDQLESTFDRTVKYAYLIDSKTNKPELDNNGQPKVDYNKVILGTENPNTLATVSKTEIDGVKKTVTDGGTRITNLASAGDITKLENATNAVNAADLFNESNRLENKGLSFQGDRGELVKTKLGETLNLKGGVASVDELSDKGNIGVIQDGSDGLSIRLNKKISGITNIDLGGVTISQKDGLNNGGKTIKNVGDAVNGDEAVNKKQLDGTFDRTVKYVLNKDGTIDHYTVILGEDQKEDGKYLDSPVHPLKIDTLTKNVTDATGKLVELNVTKVKKGVKITNLANGLDYDNIEDMAKLAVTAENASNAVNVADLVNVTNALKKKIGSDVDDKIGKKYRYFNGDDHIGDIANDKSVKVALDEALNLRGGAAKGSLSQSGNIGIFKSNDNTLNIRLNRNIAGITRIDFGDTNTGVSISSTDGLNNGGKTIKNVGDAVNGDEAVNKKQLDDAFDRTVKYVYELDKATGKILVDETTGKPRIDYTTVALGQDIKNPNGTYKQRPEAPTVTKVTKDNKEIGLNVDGGTQITNLASGLKDADFDKIAKLDIDTFKANASNAVNVADLFNVAKSLDEKINSDVNDKFKDAGLSFAGDKGSTTKKLGETLNVTGGATGELSENNIGVDADDSSGLKIKLSKNINDIEKITFNKNPTDEIAVSIGKDGLNNGGKKITHVLAGTEDDDAVNVKQLRDEITKHIQDDGYQGWSLAVNEEDNDGKKIASGKKVKLVSSNENIAITREDLPKSQGQKVTFALADHINIKSVTTGKAKLSDGGLVINDANDEPIVKVIDKGLIVGRPDDLDNPDAVDAVKVTNAGIHAGNKKITGVADGKIAGDSKDAINGSQLYAQGNAIKNIIGDNTVVTYGPTNPKDPTSEPTLKVVATDGIGGTGKNTIDGAIRWVKNQKATVYTAGDNIKIDIDEDHPDTKIISTTKNVKFESVTILGDKNDPSKGVTINKKGINAGDMKVSHVAPGTIAPLSTDAVNGGQLYQVRQDMNDIDKRARSGIASAMASAGLPQAYLPGKSMIGAAASTYRGEAALAIGVSTISDNGKWLVKADANANRKDFGVSLGVGYQW